MAIGERAALGVLAREADMRALGQQGGEGQCFCVAVLDRPLVEDLLPALKRLAQLAVNGERVGELDQLRVQRPQALLGDLRLDLRALGPVELAGAAGDGRVLELAALDLAAQLLQDLAELVAALVRVAFDLGLGDYAALDQPLGVEVAQRRVLLDRRRLLRLGVGGLVGLVVAVAAVADQVDDDVAVELLAVGHR